MAGIQSARQRDCYADCRRTAGGRVGAEYWLTAMADKLLNAVLWIGWWIAIAIVGSACLVLVGRALDISFASTVLGLLSLLVACCSCGSSSCIPRIS